MRRALSLGLLPATFLLIAPGFALAQGGPAGSWRGRVAGSLLEQAKQGEGELDCLVVVRAPAGGGTERAPLGLPGLATAAGAITDLEKELGSRGLKVTQRYTHLPIARITVPAAVLPALAADARVTGLAPVRVAHALGVEGRGLVGVPALADMGLDGRGVGVALLDTAVDADALHDTAAGPGGGVVIRLGAGRGGAGEEGGRGHGTSVAGIVAGPRWGVAPGARIVSVPVLDSRGEGDSARILAGIDAVLSSIASGDPYHIRVLLLALGGYDDIDWPPGSDTCDAVSPDFAAAFTALANAGVLVVAAAGNGGCATGVAWPACVSSALAVGSVYAGRVCSASLAPQFGCRSYAVSHPPGRCIPEGCSDQTAADRVACSSDSSPALGLWAPGGCVRALGRGGTYVDCFSGTSAAAASVAGVAALLAAAEPARTVAELRGALVAAGPVVEDPRNGTHKHRLDASAALGLLRKTCPAPAAPEGLVANPPQACGGQGVALHWKPVSGVSSYRMQMAATASFSAAREVASAGTTFLFRPDKTTTAATFFRVAAVAACGSSSSWSEAAQLRYEPQCAGRQMEAPSAPGGPPGVAPAAAPREAAGHVAYLPGVAGSHRGADGATWSTEVTLANPGSLPATAQVNFIGDLPNASDTVTVAIPPASERSYHDVLPDLLSISRDTTGYLLVRSDRPLNVVGRTSARAVENGKIRVFGQAIPALTRDDVLTGSHTGTLAGLRSDGALHTDLDLVNVGHVPADVEVRFLAEDGKPLGSLSLPGIAAGAQAQRTRALPAGVAAARGVVSVTPADAQVIGYAAVVNGDTGEARTVPLKVER